MGAVPLLLLIMSSSSLQLSPSTSESEPVQFARPIIEGGTFSNPKSFTNWTGVPGVFNVVKVFFTEKNLGKTPKQEILDKTLPVKTLTNFSSRADLYAAWLGHSTVLVHMEGATFITDPIWVDKASPVPLLGAKRYRPPPMKLDDLPKIDFAVISHDHYDHLDKETVKKIDRENPEMRWYVPLGMKKWMDGEGIRAAVVEMNWGENVTAFVDGKPFEIWCLPAQHWGQRGPLDRNERLWSGWAVVGPTKKFYYSGDTGYCRDEFIKIGRKFGSFDLAAIPIGCFEPRWFMKAQHISPVEAVEIHKDVRSEMTIGVHWGTYQMGAYEEYMEPKLLLDRLMREEKKKGHSKTFRTLTAGDIWSQK